MINLKKLYYLLPYKLQRSLDVMAYKVNPGLEEDFILNNNIGSKYNLTEKDKRQIIKRIKYSLSKIQSATDLNIHIYLAKHLLTLDDKEKNFIVECGAFKGATSVTLSIISKIIGRKLIIYDSFDGLPSQETGEQNLRNYLHLKVKGYYEEGMYTGKIEEVIDNLKSYGEYESCILRKGYFDDSLLNHNEKIDMLFLDVDLLSSTKSCVKNLWPYLVDNAYLFTDDSCDLSVVKLWFDKNWWRDNLDLEEPLYIGSGCGLNLSKNYSSLGYTVKNPQNNEFNKIDWLRSS